MASILLVEDNEISREIMSRRLRKNGYDVLFAVDGSQAISAATDKHPDLILMDMNLPGIDGWEATREIRKRPVTSAIPVIALTADTLPKDQKRAAAVGCDEYEPKPVDFTSLIHKIETLLAEGRGQRRQSEILAPHQPVRRSRTPS
jgi:two-component system cell cycle response regulator DivK